MHQVNANFLRLQLDMLKPYSQVFSVPLDLSYNSPQRRNF